MSETCHIFFHDDVDGIISAALFLHNNVKGRYRLYPISSSWRGPKFNVFFSSIAKKKNDKKVILDFQYHKDSDLWIDHHFDKDFGDCEIKNNKIVYGPKSASAARLVNYIRLNNEVDYDQSFISTVDMIDSASYKDVNQIFTDKNPLMVLRAYLEKLFPSDMTYCRIVEIIDKCKMDIKEALHILRISPIYVDELRDDALKIKRSIVIAKKISIVNQKRKNQYPRFSEYLTCPDIKYSLRITSVGNEILSVQIGFNPFQKQSNEINIGKMLNDSKLLINGGGHYNVGACLIKEKNINEFIDNVSIILNEEGVDSMEKYAVDSTDPIEKKASELVKTGESKNLSQARCDVAKKINQQPGQLEVSDADGEKE